MKTVSIFSGSLSLLASMMSSRLPVLQFILSARHHGGTKTENKSDLAVIEAERKPPGAPSSTSPLIFYHEVIFFLFLFLFTAAKAKRSRCCSARLPAGREDV